MPSQSLLHIFIKPKIGVTDEQVKAKINLAVDWYKYSEYCWIVKTTSDSAKWQTRLKPLVDDKTGSLLILPIDKDTKRQGWMIKGFWDWIKNDKPINKLR